MLLPDLKLVSPNKSLDPGSALNVREIGSDAGSVDDVVDWEAGHEGRVLQQQRQRLADASTGTHHCYIALHLNNTVNAYLVVMHKWYYL